MRQLRTARRLRDQFGTTYAVLAVVDFVARIVADRIRERRLRIEGERGILGPAHIAYDGNSLSEHRAVWSGWDWTARGEEWSESPEWKQALVDEVLMTTIPQSDVIVEIGPGGGRWTEYLLDRANRLILVDVVDETLDACRQRFGRNGNDISYIRNAGSNLPGVPDSSVDALWSFDVFVHVAPVDIANYLSEIARVLRPGGTAVIHHAGSRGSRDHQGGVGWRSPMTAPLFANLATDAGVDVVRQFDSWGDDGRFGVRVYGDVISVLTRKG